MRNVSEPSAALPLREREKQRGDPRSRRRLPVKRRLPGRRRSRPPQAPAAQAEGGAASPPWRRPRSRRAAEGSAAPAALGAGRRLPPLPPGGGAEAGPGRRHADERPVPRQADAAVPRPGRRYLQELGEGDDGELQHGGRAERGGEVSAGARRGLRLPHRHLGLREGLRLPQRHLDVRLCVFLLLLSRKFVFFNIPQIQYKNPWVQIMLFRNMTPSPFLRFYLGRCRRDRRAGPAPLSRPEPQGGSPAQIRLQEAAAQRRFSRWKRDLIRMSVIRTRPRRLGLRRGREGACSVTC